jgi:protein-L-isoaspartate(D-aspartate) O-methyltransferase
LNSGLAKPLGPKEELISSLKSEGLLKSRNVEDALRKIHREDFVWEGNSKALAYLDEPAPLGKTGQTISAPHMIAIMLEKLELAPGMKVLEVGTGSGYNACLIGSIVSKDLSTPNEPLVITIERHGLLAQTAEKNIRRAGLSSIVKVVEGDGSLGYPSRSAEPSYDRILVTAAAPKVPYFLTKQLKETGILVIPVGDLRYQNLLKITRMKNDQFRRKEVTACVFVPLIGEDAYRP